MEPLMEPFRQPGMYACESDSDMETPQLSEGLTETENDTPPETPLRSSILFSDADVAKCYRFEGPPRGKTGLLSVPPPARVSAPLVVANPHPIRPSLHSFRLFHMEDRHSVTNDDGGYDSEHEDHRLARTSLGRFRSVWRTDEDDATVRARPVRQSPLATPKVGSGGDLWGESSPILKRPRHPPPMVVPFSPLISPRGAGTQTDDLGQLANTLSSFQDLLLIAPGQTSLLRGIDRTGIAILPKDRRNEFTGLGYGLPPGLEEDTSRVPTVVPTRHVDPLPVPDSPLHTLAPKINPIVIEEDMSPLSLPGSFLSPSSMPLNSTESNGYFVGVDVSQD